MSKRRSHISLTTKLACALAELEFWRGTILPFTELQAMDAATYLRRFEWDHSTPHAVISGPAHFTNLTPLLRDAHRRKTATIDIPRIAKGKRIARKQAVHQARMAEKMIPVDVRGDRSDGRSSRPKHVMLGSKASPFKRKISGKVERRT